MEAIEVDYARAMADGTRGGLSTASLDNIAPRFSEGVARVLGRVQNGELGFWELPATRAHADAATAYAASLPEKIRHVLVLGIGGSSLGPRAALDALAGPPTLAYLRPDRQIHLPDNSDPWFLNHLLESLPAEETVAVAISKSGGTVETAAQVLIVREWFREHLGSSWKSHMAVVTDPDQGPLRELANQEGLSTFEVPPNVGGRFSVLSSVGLVPLALAGIDVGALLDGAASMGKRCETQDLRQNPAGIIAAVHYLQHTEHGRGIHVMMPYADGLRAFAAWYVQLWPESLGKRNDRSGKRVEVGPTPLPAVGATDQHAQMQLFMEGPRDKIVTFMRVRHGSSDLAIPRSEGAFAYLGTHTLAGVLDAELRGTATALADDGRPSITISLEHINASTIGGLFFLYEAATAFAGELYDIDAFDQPGVEEGKRLASGLLGRPGYEGARTDVEKSENSLSAQYRV
ncbi:MAG: hypothetical protein KC416_13415 [Myxococcales bacterium]|nr:hypothetical protein [Myxococcales bacterium]